jgi:phosphate transport system protein
LGGGGRRDDDGPLPRRAEGAAGVLEALRLAIDALREADSAETSQQVLEGWDDVIDAFYREVEKRCTDLLALQQPVAGDLRLILSSFKIVTDLERVGDLSLNLAQYAASGGAFLLVPRSRVVELAEHAQKMFEDALRAFRKDDAELAKGLIERDLKLNAEFDSLRTETLRQLVKSVGEQHTVPLAAEIAGDAVTALLSIRDIERIGDHAENIGRRIVYWLTGEAKYL